MAAHKNHQEQEYKIMRAVCLWLHDNKCFVCKKQFDSLDCHHIDKNSKNHVLYNLMPLCNEHHKIVGMFKELKQFSKTDINSLLLSKIEFFKSLNF